MKKPKILFVSSLTSEKVFNLLSDTATNKPRISIQKFHTLLVEGMVVNGTKVDVLSSPPINNYSHKKIFWKLGNEKIGNLLTYKHLIVLNIKIIRRLLLFLNCFFATIIWCLKKGDKVIVCDVLKIETSLSLLAAKIFRIPTVAIVTDIPLISTKIALNKKVGFVEKFLMWYIKFFARKYDSFMFLTEQMNSVLNIKGKPYIIVEGFVDVNAAGYKNEIEDKSKIRKIVYAGGLYESFGIKHLIEAFIKLPFKNIELSLYGYGNMDAIINSYSEKDKRIKFYGMVNNEEIINIELKATLLVNPRPANLEITKYSFPSKNMEYMASGTPVVSSKLSGMPEEYFKYIYTFNDYSINCFYITLKKILSATPEELHEKGQLAKTFVLAEKSNIIQAKKLLSFISKL